jgi:superfamily II DNA/RNA helicase
MTLHAELAADIERQREAMHALIDSPEGRARIAFMAEAFDALQAAGFAPHHQQIYQVAERTESRLMDATQSAIYAGPCRRRDYVKRGKVERVVQLMRDDLLTADEAGRLLDRLSLSFEAQARIVRDVVAQRP